MKKIVLAAVVSALSAYAYVDARSLSEVPADKIVEGFRRFPVKAFVEDGGDIKAAGAIEATQVAPGAQIQIIGDWRERQLAQITIGDEPYIVRFGDLKPRDVEGWNAYFGGARPNEGSLCYARVKGNAPTPSGGQTTKAFC